MNLWIELLWRVFMIWVFVKKYNLSISQDYHLTFHRCWEGTQALDLNYVSCRSESSNCDLSFVNIMIVFTCACYMLILHQTPDSQESCTCKIIKSPNNLSYHPLFPSGSPRGPFCRFGPPLSLLFMFKVPFFSLPSWEYE